VLDDQGGQAAVVARFVERLADAEPERREAALRLLAALEELLADENL
jgi:hypothetical protein